MYSRLLYILFTAGFLFSSCIDPIKLKIDTDQQTLTVEGLIADSLDTYRIRMFYSSVIGVGNDNVFEPVIGASVKVVEDGGTVFEFLEAENGMYVKEMQGEAGRSYHVEIVTANGKNIRSKPAVLTGAPKVTSINTEIIEETSLSSTGNVLLETILNLKLNTSIDVPQNPLYLRWRAEGEYEFRENYPMALSPKTCYINNNIDFNNLKIFDTQTLDGNQIVNEPFISMPLDYRFAIQYCFHIMQYSMTEQEFHYWDAVNDIINIDGSLFDPPPGTVKGNLYNAGDPNELILGYFSVSGVSYKRFWANPQSLNVIYIEPKCHSSSFRPLSPDCRDCTTVHSSTLVRPEYWKP